MWKKSLIVAIPWLMALWPSMLAGQEPRDAQSAMKMPERGALVDVDSVKGQPEQVTVLIDGPVSRPRLRSMIDSAAKKGNWSWEGLTVEILPFTSLWEQATEEKARPHKQTIGRLSARGLVQREEGKLVVADFVKVFRAYAPVRVVYRIAGPFSLAKSWRPELEGFEIHSYSQPGWYVFDAARTKRAPAAPSVVIKRGNWRVPSIVGAVVLIAGTALTILVLLRSGRRTHQREGE